MEKLFKAIGDLVPEHDVVDFRLLADVTKAAGQDVQNLDQGFADALAVAEGPIAVESLF